LEDRAQRSRGQGQTTKIGFRSAAVRREFAAQTSGNVDGPPSNVAVDPFGKCRKTRAIKYAGASCRSCQSKYWAVGGENSA